MKDDFYVYGLFRHDTGEIFYVGKGRGDRIAEHGGKSDKVNKWKFAIIRKAKDAGQDVMRIKIHEGLTNSDAQKIERRLIKEIGRANIGSGPLVNMTDGGEGTLGRKASVETRRKMSEKARSREITQPQKDKISAAIRAHHAGGMKTEHREAIRGALKGRKMSDEQKMLLSEIAKRRPPVSDDTKSKMRGSWTEEKRALFAARARAQGTNHLLESCKSWTGRKHSEETKAKMSASMTGIKRSEEAKLKNSIAKKAMWADPVWKAKELEARRLRKQAKAATK